MVFGDGHFVVVHHHDKVRRVFARIVKPFECFAAAQGTVADYCNHVALFALDIAGGCKPERKAYGSRCMAYHKVVMFAFARFGIARDAPVLVWIQERLGAACQNLVRVALVANVVDNLVLRGFKNVMQRDGRFHESEIRRQVPATFGNLVQERRADFGCEHLELAHVHLFHVGGGGNLFY